MKTFDTVDADQIEIGDFISVGGVEYEIIDSLPADTDDVKFLAVGVSDDMEHEIVLRYDQSVDLVADL